MNKLTKPPDRLLSSEGTKTHKGDTVGKLMKIYHVIKNKAQPKTIKKKYEINLKHLNKHHQTTLNTNKIILFIFNLLLELQ